MTRRRNSSAEGFMDLVSKLPWWAGVVLALISYLMLHAVATRPMPPPQPGVRPANHIGPMLWRGLATGGQYVLPILFLGGAAASALGRRQRKQLLNEAAERKGQVATDGMSWQQFEMLVGEAFRQRGFTVVEQGGGGADGGVDLVVSNGSERFLVQCKQWRAYKVGVTVVRELYGVMAATGAAGGYVVTSGVFTQEARDFAQGRNIELIDGGALPAFLRATPQKAQVSAASRGAATPAAPISAAACPKCGAVMVKRVARKGASAGKAFWGCTNYPACSGTREIGGP